MKKPTEQHKNWLKLRARNEFKRSHGERWHDVQLDFNGGAPRWKPQIVRAWSGNGVEQVLCVGGVSFPPEVICLQKNSNETLVFLAKVRDKLAIRRLPSGPQKKVWVTKNPRRKLREIRTFSDFSKITEISTSAAVVLAAEYDRARSVIGSAPPTINLDEWSNEAFSTLYELGFFEIVGITEDTEKRYADSQSGETRTMRILSGSNSNELRNASESILKLSRFIDEDGPLTPDVVSALNSAIGEAMINVARHAYPENHESLFVQVGRWWVAASANRPLRRLNVVIYDQGASIPWTLPKQTWAAYIYGIVDRVAGSGLSGEYPADPDYIEFAMGEGRTQTGEPGRGEGLPQMRDFVKICGAGSLTILSRAGKCVYVPGRRLVKEHLATPIDGTLIEWNMTLR